MSKLACSACKFRRCKCTSECEFAPYFPPDDEPQRFAVIHQVFGASNVANLLNELPANQRQDAINSMYYEAETRLLNPVYGCVGFISFLQQHLKNLLRDLASAKDKLATYAGVNADKVNSPAVPSPSSDPWMIPVGVPPIIRESNDPQPQSLAQAQQLAASELQRMVAILQGRGGKRTAEGDGIDTAATGFSQMDMDGADGLAGLSRILERFREAYQIPQEPEQGHHILPDLLQRQVKLQPSDTAGPLGPADTAGARAGAAAD
ncbi:PREDICTED: LOB domain-containing protein 10-like [Tarenaya hassleriana]|uniref:LOB domain-containing protein 10-like n=1 Tax=Tarenaya hassleriana TaxID=28532 RepID=UPI00053C9C33|nr:PREDICTED: LOB domain-containing protein 10-like [Tarenaya hassleriana]XP_010531218.1 PREDICTED: LOB domain-containing protein 10-like [Tarenaya hassleriana]